MIPGVAQALAASLQAAAGKSYTYRRGSASCDVSAYVGSTTYQSMGQVELIEEVTAQDFIFPAAELVLSGVQTLPQRGDTITEADECTGATLTYQVMSPAGGNSLPYRYSDTSRQVLRVHAKQVS